MGKNVSGLSLLLSAAISFTSLPGSAAAAPSICNAIPGNLIVNCGFETGNFSRWTQSGNTIASFVAGPGLLGDPAGEALARAVRLDPPFSARAVRKDGPLFSVGANGIEVAELPAGVAGDEIELTARDGERIVTVDGMRTFVEIPELEALGRRYPDYVVRAARLRGTIWQVDVEQL